MLQDYLARQVEQIRQQYTGDKLTGPPQEILQKEIERGRQAREVVEHPLFLWALEKLEGMLMQAWRASTPDRTADREQIYHMIKAKDMLVHTLSELMQIAELAQHEMELKRHPASEAGPREYGGEHG